MLRISLLATCLSLTSGCWSPPLYDGPFCDAMIEGEAWPSYGTTRQFDHIDNAPWLYDNQMTEYLFGFGMSKASDTWWGLGSEDPYAYNEETLLIDSPFGRTMQGYSILALSGTRGEYLDVSVPLNDFEHYDNMLKWFAGYVHQTTWRVEGSCGDHPEAAAVTYERGLRSEKKLIVVYQKHYTQSAVSRASAVIHEVRHTETIWHSATDMCSSCDNSWTDRGSNTYQALWLAALYWAPESPYVTQEMRDDAAGYFQEIKDLRIREPFDWDLEALRDINENPRYFLHIATLYNDIRPR